MSGHTSLPFMDVEELEGAREGWFRFHCELCLDYCTGSGSFKNVELDAADHLEERHPRRWQRAR